MLALHIILNQSGLITQQKVLPFMLKEFLLFSDTVESRDNICIIEKHQIDRNHTCMYLVKSHLSSA